VKNILALSLLVFLSACGGKDKSSSSGALGNTNDPQVTVPANAEVFDYSCNEVREYVLAGDNMVRSVEYPDFGVSRGWSEGDFWMSYDEDSQGAYKSLTKARQEKISDVQYRSVSEFTDWSLADGQWTKTVRNFDRTWLKEGNLRRNLSNKVNGEEKPYYWTVETTFIDDKTERTIQRHTNPGVKNEGDIRYTKIELTCSYVRRQ
jgi:hypothetical protein